MNDLKTKWIGPALVCGACLFTPVTSWGATTIFLRAATADKTMPDGRVVPMWGFAQDTSFHAEDGTVTVPGPEITLEPGEGELIIVLDNRLPEAVSVVIPGLPLPEVWLNDVGGTLQTVESRFDDGQGRSRARSFVPETPNGNSVPYVYRFANLKPGTFLYHSGSHPAVQVQMGLYGALSKRADVGEAYPGVAIDADREATLVFSEIDADVHDAVHNGDYGPGMAMSSTIRSRPQYYLLNGMAYSKANPPPAILLKGNSNPSVPGLLRLLNAGNDSHVPTLDGRYLSIIAEDGNLYPYPKRQYSALLPAMKTMDVVFTPPLDTFIPIYDRRLGLANATQSDGGMLAYLSVGDQPFVTGKTLGTIRNNYTGFVGMKITVGANPITVSALGRIRVASNTQTHLVKLVSASTGADVTGGSVSIDMSSGTAGDFKYANLGSPVVLYPNTSYYVVSREVGGGDQWYDYNTVVTTTSVATENAAVYGPGPAYKLVGSAGRSFVPVNFAYAVGGSSTTTLTVSSSNPNGGVNVTVSPADIDEVTGGSTPFALNYNGGAVVSLTAPGTADGNNFLKWQRDGVDYATTVETSVAMDGNHTMTAVYVTPVVPGATEYVTGKTLGTIRNNYTGFVGMKITVGANPITVSALGRIRVASNTQTHLVKLVSASTGADVTGGSVSIDMSSGTAGDFKYAILGSPVVLYPNTSYYLVSREVGGGDQWYDYNTVVTTTSVATENAAVYGPGPAYNVVGSAGRSFVPVNFAYAVGGSRTTTLTVSSSNPNEGVNVTVSPADIDEVTGGSTPFALNYNGGAVVSLTAPGTAGGNNFLKWQRDGVDYATTVETSVTMDGNHTMTAVYVTPGTTEYVTGKTLGTIRNNYTGFVGMKITVGANPVSVYSLGRIRVASNTQTHLVKLVSASTGADVTGGSVSIDMSSGTAGEFQYANLAAPVTLSAGAAYYVLSQEVSGGDQWYDYNTVVTTTSVATENAAVHGPGPVYNVVGSAGRSYVPVSFKY